MITLWFYRDAAHRVHPLAGQGVNLGFGDVIVLVKLLAEASKNGAMFGDMMYLTKYETLRQRHNVPTMLAIDALHRLYKGTAAPIVLARSLGLQLTNALTPLKVNRLSFINSRGVRVEDFFESSLIVSIFFGRVHENFGYQKVFGYSNITLLSKLLY